MPLLRAACSSGYLNCDLSDAFEPEEAEEVVYAARGFTPISH